MPRHLLLLRHGTAEDKGNRPDPERRLTTEGEAEARAAGVAIRALRVPVDVVLASPKVRAWRTAELACEALDVDPVEHRALVGFDRDEAESVSGAGERVVVVGHDPDFSQVIHDLTGARVALPKGGLAIVQFGHGSPRLHALLRPAALAALAG